MPAHADDSAILRCRQIADATQRLACYDALAVGARPALPASQAPAQFGIVQRAPADEIDAIESSIEGLFPGWAAKDTIRLANGQVWQINDDSRAVLNFSNPKVKIRRGALGAFYLEIEGTNRSPRVKRVK